MTPTHEVDHRAFLDLQIDQRPVLDYKIQDEALLDFLDEFLHLVLPNDDFLVVFGDFLMTGTSMIRKLAEMESMTTRWMSS